MKSAILLEQPVILERPAHWSRIFVWLIIAITTSGVVWAAVAKIEQAVPATGKLEPQGSVKEIKAPTGGVLREIHVQDGQVVKQGQLLLTFDPTAPKAEIDSLHKIKKSLVNQSQFYATTVSGTSLPHGAPDLVALTRLRAALIAENKFYKAQIQGLSLTRISGDEFDVTQQQLLVASRAEHQSRVANAQLQIKESEKELSQTQGQLVTARKVVALNQQILNQIEPVVAEGAISKLQYQRQQQEVLTSQAEVDRLNAESQRLKVEISQATEQLQNTLALSTKDVLTKIAENQKKIAEIDAQLSNVSLENQKKIAEIDAQISKAELSLQYQEIRTPVNGVVFNLQPHAPGFVADSNQALMTIVPNDNLIAHVFLTNKDIGFVQQGMEADVKIESFPESEFGSIEGKLVWVGSDALAPTQEKPFYTFPAKIQLNRQSLLSNGKELPLQSGMAVNCSIKVRKRTVLSIFMHMFEQKVKSLETVR